VRSEVMGKLRSFFTSPKKLPEWVLPLVFLVWLFMEITEYGHRPFVEGFMEDFTDPLLYYIFIGVGIVSFVIVYFVKRNEKNKVDEDEEVNKSVQEENSSNGGMTIVVIVWILVMILGYFNTKSSKETEKRVEDFMEQKKIEQIDPHLEE
jgi:hypothetical protein